MFDVAPTELLLVAFVALIVIGPKDLPKAMRFVGYWVGRARGVARQFRSGFDTMMREAELAEMEKKWKEENARIMREHPADALPAPAQTIVHMPEPVTDETLAAAAAPREAPVMTEQPVLKDADEAAPAETPAQKPVS